MPPSKRFYQTGETVFGLWPGSGGLYFKGVIVESDPAVGTYDVKFEEGTTYTLLEKHVKPVDSFKILEPKASQQQVRRRGRSSSGNRSRSRSRTPGRKPKVQSTTDETLPTSPKSSSKQEQRKLGKPRKSSETKPRILYKITKQDIVDDIPLSARRSPRSKVVEDFQEDLPLSRRRSSRIADKEKVSQTKSEDEGFSDEFSSSEMNKPNGKDQSEVKSVFGQENMIAEGVVKNPNSFTALLSITSYLSLIFFFYLICRQNKCLFEGIPQFTLSDLVSMYNPFVSFGIEMFHLTLFLLSMLPTGEIVTIGEGQLCRRNSLFSAVVMISSLLALKHYLNFSASKVMTHLPQFLIPNFVVGFVVSVIVSYRTRGNRSSDTSILSHFIIGSVTNVSIAGVNVKVWVHRAIFTTVIALNCLALEANFEKNQALSPTLASVAAMQIIFAVEALLNDAHLFLSFEFLNVKTGWMYLTMLSYPLMSFLITLSVTNSGLELPLYCLAPIGVLFVAGFLIKVGSTSQKAAFTQNPDDSSFSNMEVLTSTSDGKLLISGWWGWMRHPNYLGDILMHFAFALPCGFQMFLPYLVVLFIVVSFIFRALENDVAGKLKYGPSWDRYCQRVPSRVIPHVF